MTKEREECLARLIAAFERNDFESLRIEATEAWQHESVLDNLAYASASALIESGGHFDDLDSIDLGIEIALAFLESPDIPHNLKAQVRYNLANGYSNRALHYEKMGDLDARNANWDMKWHQMQITALNYRDLPSGMQTEALTNFANTLSELGRKVEAIATYRKVLSIYDKHPVALGCLGQVYASLVGIQPANDVFILLEASQLLGHALREDGAIERHSSPGARKNFEVSLEFVEEMLASIFSSQETTREEFEDHSISAHADWKPDLPDRAWAEKGLYLSLNPHPEWCPLKMRDDLFFDGLITASHDDGEKLFTILAHTMNQIKEEFATSRYLLYLAGNPNIYANQSKATIYADTLDYSDFGLSSGFLKNSIRLSIDILDKVANFMNRYLELGIKDRNVSFFTIWYEKGDVKKGNNVALSAHLGHASWLKGIQEVAKTLNAYPAPSKDIRNKVTHDFLLIENVFKPVVILNGERVTVDAHEYAEELLHMAKGVVVNLIAYVQRTEGMKEPAEGKMFAPITFRYAEGITDELHS